MSCELPISETTMLTADHESEYVLILLHGKGKVQRDYKVCVVCTPSTAGKQQATLQKTGRHGKTMEQKCAYLTKLERQWEACRQAIRGARCDDCNRRSLEGMQ